MLYQDGEECSASPRAAGSWVVVKARMGNTSSNSKRQAFWVLCSFRVIDSQTIWKRQQKERPGSYKICLLLGVPLVKDTQLRG